jgi:nucleotide-binding universal stress UspA family protein
MISVMNASAPVRLGGIASLAGMISPARTDPIPTTPATARTRRTWRPSRKGSVRTAGSSEAIAIADASVRDARLSLLHVIEVPPELRVPAVSYDNLDGLHAAVQADILTRLRSLVPSSASPFCSVETATAAGAAGHAILTFAEERAADLIVMGAQGHGAFDRWLFGSKTRDVVCGSTCPVLTVRS